MVWNENSHSFQFKNKCKPLIFNTTMLDESFDVGINMTCKIFKARSTETMSI